MNWMSALLETYERCVKDPSTRTEKIPLLPIYHTLNNMHITVTIDGDGNFLRAEIVPKGEQNTMIPCTEDSAGRTSGITPHPLDDKLVYLSGDFNEHVRPDIEKKGEPEDEESYQKKIRKKKEANAKAHEMYIDQLKEWCAGPYSNKKAYAVLKYVEKGTLISDLIKQGILIVGEDGYLLEKEDCPDAPLFSISKISNKQSDAFVRWSVDCENDVRKRTWEDEDISESWISFIQSKDRDEGICYITGKSVPLAQNHPSKIRNSGDMAKIVSANDSTGFTFRGRFENSEQAYGIGNDTTQKAHSALRWLIGRQGYHCGDLCIVSWTSNGEQVRSPSEDFSDILFLDCDEYAFTDQEAAKHLNQRILGYNSKILNENVFIMGLDSAQTGKGRISITFFRQELGRDFVERIEKWHQQCSWIHSYAKIKGDDGKERRASFIGAPTPYDIANAAYGIHADERIKSNAVKRILPCIIDGTEIPRDIVESTILRACRPQTMEKWEWMKTLSIACSIYKKLNGGIYKMTLEKERRTRDYLYGRLLAVADLMEESALRKAGEMNRQTTAIRLMQRFSEFPYSTWGNIELALAPYAARLGPLANYYESKISEIMDMFDGDDFRNNSKLSGEFLLAYHCQREDQYRKKENKEDKDKEE